MRKCAALRADLFIWIIRHVQGLLTLALYWATVWDVLDWHDIGCSLPRRVDANITCIVTATIGILYLIASTGRTRTSWLYWHPILQLSLDAFLLPVWLIPTAGAAGYDCRSVCKVCQPHGGERVGFYMWIGQMTCSCFVASNADTNAVSADKAVAVARKSTLESRYRPGKGRSSTKVFLGASRIGLIQWLQWAMIACIVFTFVRAIWILCQKQAEEDVLMFIEPDVYEGIKVVEGKDGLSTIYEKVVDSDESE